MSHPFSQTVRSLNADSHRGALVGLCVAMALMAVWGIWFFYAPISIYRTTRDVCVVGKETVALSFKNQGWTLSPRPVQSQGQILSARFSIPDASSIRVGQQAMVRMKTTDGDRTFPAVVKAITPGPDAVLVRLRMKTIGALPDKALLDPFQVDVAIDRLSPAELALAAYERQMKGEPR